ncbi:YegP family protein [Candidatus Saccharibacteria bacterium]|nr:YegP family protein [Candidatus Saccharibacteria bacterium]
MKFEILENTQTPEHTYRWRLLAEDGRVIARSRKYKTLKSCQNDVHYVALSAVSISLDRLLSPDTFSLANLFASGLASPDCPPEEVPLDPATVFYDL